MRPYIKLHWSIQFEDACQSVLLAAMKASVIATLLFVWGPARAQTSPTAQSRKEELSSKEQIKAALAKQKADEENGSKARPWDRNAKGRRPWEVPPPESGQTKP